MKQRLLFSLGFLALSASGLAQNGDRKGHDNMNDIVPTDLIPEAPVLTVNQALETFKIAEGFQIEPVAAEPMVDKPVALTFDARGRMWVVEMRGYMASIDGKEESDPLGRIVILEDSSGDGQVDKRSVFLDQLLLPRSIALVPGGVLVGDQNQLYFVARRNGNGDLPEGELQVVDADYAKGGNVEHKPNGLMPALDNWMYNAKSDHRYQWRDGQLVKERTLFRGQWGLSQDDWGRLFFNSNSTLLIGDRALPNLLTGNDKIKLKASLSSRVGDNRVWPSRVTPGVNRAYISTLNGYDSDTISPKTFKLINATGACGPVIYRGSQFPDRFRGMAFVTESASHLVKAIQPARAGGQLTGTHPYGETEFLTSTDERFRPVNLYNAPDGTLYLLDLYHGIIQHKTYMTSYLRRQTLSRGLEAPGLGYGRIYRIKARDRALTSLPPLEGADTATLISTLHSPDGSHRDLAQKLIVDQRKPEAPSLLRAALTQEASAVTQAHLLWCLEGLGALGIGDLQALLSSEHPDLQASALYASLSLEPEERSTLLSQVIALSASKDLAPYQARFYAETGTPESMEALVALLQNSGRSKKDLVWPAALAGLEENATLFSQVNAGRYQQNAFDKLVEQSTAAKQVKVDPASLLHGEHLASYQRGQALYSGRAACIGCHGADGSGLPNLGPTLDRSNWVTEDHQDLAKVLLYGLQGPIKINGKKFIPQAFMPGLAQNPTISDQDLADIMTFLRHGWSNRASQITASEITEIRAATKHLTGTMMKAADFPSKQ